MIDTISHYQAPPITGLRCTNCHSGQLNFTVTAVCCAICGQQYPVIGGVPVMFEAITIHDAEVTDNDTARQVLTAFGLPDDPLSLLRIRTMMRRQVRFGGTLIQTESRQFLDRVRNSGHEISALNNRHDNAAEADPQAAPRYGWTKNYMPRRMQAGATILANMRLENRGSVTIYHDGPGQVNIALHWRHRDGTSAAAPDERTPLPIDILPGHAVTVPTRITCPKQPGGYLLTVTLVQEGIRWLDEDSTTTAVTLEDENCDPVPQGWNLLPDPPVSYDKDHDRGRTLLEDWLRQHAPTRPRLLEVGGNAVPMLREIKVDLGPDPVNTDVDLLGLQIGHMAGRQRRTAIRQICADAFNLPFEDGHFDAIVVFASLHHFPDPAALLEHLRRKMRFGGFIGVFCEPVGHIWPGAVEPNFLAELKRGVNEQSFSLREYELIFRQADLQAAEVVVDGNSLKARLIHMAAQGGR